MSDPFQPIERKLGISLECLKVFAKTGYPFIVSTKNALIAEGEYLSVLKDCNCVVQFSAVCSKYDSMEKGASTFEQRLKAMEIISQFKRVNARVQPYAIEFKADVMRSISKFRNAGVHGAIFEGMKYISKRDGMVKVGGDFCYPSAVLQRDFGEFKNQLHKFGMKFYCGENRLRGMSDELCCCGIEGMGWKANTANLNHFIFDRKSYAYSPAQLNENSRAVFKTLHQTAEWGANNKFLTYKQGIEKEITPSKMRYLLPDNYKQ